MVVLSAAVLTQGGKVLLSRQFVDMARIRIEGLLTAFPRLMGTGRQYTYFDTDTVRYVYQPMEKLYLVLITNKSSNIVEDLDTLRLLGRVVSDKAPAISEEAVSKVAFGIIMAFDEVIQMGYRENVTLEQVHQFLEMDSAEEKVQKVIQENKITEAKRAADLKAKEISKDRQTGISSQSFSSSAISSDSYSASPAVDSHAPITKPTIVESSPPPLPGKGMKLVSKSAGKANVLAQMARAGEFEAPVSSVVAQSAAPAALATSQQGAVHIKIDEKINMQMTREGGVQNLEVKGDMFLTVNDAAYGAVKIQLARSSNFNDYAWKTHPNINKNDWNNRALAPRDAGKPFPAGSALGILRWRLNNTAGFKAPLTITAWPSEDSCTIEYELNDQKLELQNVAIQIPLNGASANVTNIDAGSYQMDGATDSLVWQIPRIDSNNNSASLEFGLSNETEVFPILVNFYSQQTLANVVIEEAVNMNTGGSAPYTSENLLSVEQYAIV